MVIVLFGCGGKLPTEKDTSVFNEEQRQIANQIISIFENDTPVIQYSYAEYLDDGRGITAGRAGFTSATGDMLEVVVRYTEIAPDNPLAQYIPRLEELAESEDGSIVSLEGLEENWGKCAEDEIFRNIQDEVVDEYYYIPATVHAEELGVLYPLTLLNLYDAIIQHGDGDDLDGLPALIERTILNVGGTPKEGIDESVWLEEFMNVRRDTLLNPDNQGTQEEWSESVGRVDTLLEIYQRRNYDLSPPILIDTWGRTFTVSGKQ